MASGWSQYAVMVRRCNTQIWGAGLFGHDGTMWGQDGLPLKTTKSYYQVKISNENCFHATIFITFCYGRRSTNQSRSQ